MVSVRMFLCPVLFGREGEGCDEVIVCSWIPTATPSRYIDLSRKDINSPRNAPFKHPETAY